MGIPTTSAPSSTRTSPEELLRTLSPTSHLQSPLSSLKRVIPTTLALSSTRMLPEVPLRILSLISHPQSPLSSLKNPTKTVCSLSVVRTSPEETSRTLSLISHLQSLSLLPRNPTKTACSPSVVRTSPEETSRTSSSTSHPQSLSLSLKKSDKDGMFAFGGENVTRGNLKNLVVDKPSPITVALAQQRAYPAGYTPPVADMPLSNEDTLHIHHNQTMQGHEEIHGASKVGGNYVTYAAKNVTGNATKL